LPDVSWYGPDGKPIEWAANGPSLTSIFGTSGLDDPAARAILIMLHASDDSREFRMPKAAVNLKWRLFIDTAAEAPDDIHPEADGPELTNEPVLLDGHTLRCYVAE
jgi:glycogen operon protein